MGHVRRPVPHLRVAPGLAMIGASADCAIYLPLCTGSSCPPHRMPCACICSRTRHRRAPTSYCQCGIPLHDFLQQFEKYNSDSSGDCSGEEVGDEEEEEDGARLVSAQYVRAVADVSRTALLLTSSLRPLSVSSQMSHDSSLSSGSATLTHALSIGSQWSL